MTMDIGLRPRNAFSGYIRFEFSVLYLCSVAYLAPRHFYGKPCLFELESMLAVFICVNLTGCIPLRTVEEKAKSSHPRQTLKRRLIYLESPLS
jgi:hypothetical protein